MTLRVEVPEKILNAECKCSPFPTDIKKETKWFRRFKAYIKDAWSIRSKITVEPFIICYVLPSVLAALAVQTVSLEKSCRVNLNYDNKTCDHIMLSQTQNYSEQEKQATRMVSTMTGWSFPLQTALSGILTLFLGSWSDRTGNRKTFMVLPILGKLVATIGVILSTVFMVQVGLNETALLDGLPPALTGGRAAMTMAVYSYITDITTESERTFRLGIITGIFTLTRPVGQALSGYMMKYFGYFGVFSVACFFYLIGFIYIMQRITPTTKAPVKSIEPKSCGSMFFVNDLIETVNVGLKQRKSSRRLQLFLILITYMLIVGPVLGETQMTLWFTRHKFNFTEVDYSLFLTYSALIGILGSFITIYVFTKKWKMDDITLGVIACLSRIAGSVAYGLAPTSKVYFLGPLLDIFSSAGASCLRSIATKLVNSDEIGKTSSLISISEALVPAIYSPLYSAVYNRTLSTLPGAFYLISALLAVPAIAILIVLHFLRKTEAEEDIAAKTEAPETKPRENEITSF